MLIDAVITKGMNGAHRAIHRQKKYFSMLGLPGTGNMKDGTLNLDISPYEFDILGLDYLFENVMHKRFPKKRMEDFGFIKIDSVYFKGQEFTDWGYIYIPFSSPHRKNKSLIELIGPDIEHANNGDRIRISVADEKIFYQIPSIQPYELTPLSGLLSVR